MKAAIFDMDGTILDSMPIWTSFGKAYLDSVGLPTPDGLWTDIRVLSYEETADYFLSHFPLPYTREELMRIWDDFIAERYRSAAVLKDGAKEYIEKLYASGVKIALATATARFIAEEMLETHGVAQYFDLVMTEEDVGVSKNEPTLFLETAKRLGVAPEDCVIFEDSIHAVRGAKKANLTIWGILDDASLPQKEDMIALCDRIIDFRSEIAAIEG